MSKFLSCNTPGLHKPVYIPSIEGSDIYNHMFRGRELEVKYIGMIPSSLELNKLVSVGLKTRNKKASDKLISDDIINVKFKQKVDSGNQVIKKLNEKAAKQKEENIKYKNKLLEFAQIIKTELLDSKWAGVSQNDLRIKLYTEGFIYNNTKYVPYKRSSAKSRIGQCLFIKEKLYEPMIKWSRINLEFRDKPKELGIDFPSLLAYESLVGSSIESLVRINPDNILIVDDVESAFYRDSRVVRTGENGYLDSFSENSLIKNSLFDGESLLDSQYFTEGKSMMLLRNHMFKSAAFNCNIQKFLKDHCPKDVDFDEWQIPSMFKKDKVYAKDIHMITTPSSIKALKFSKLLGSEKKMWNYWKRIIKSDGCIFGICKNEKKSKQGYDVYGNILQQTSYQMLNSLPLTRDNIGDLTRFEKEYIDKLKNDDDFFIQYLEENANSINSNEMFIALYRRNKEVVNLQIFRSYRAETIRSHVTHVKNGKIRLNGDYCVMLGNPIEFLYHAVGKLNKDIPVSSSLIGNQIYTKMFGERELTGFRNPHTSPNNVLLVQNKKLDLIDKYFNLSTNIVCVNAIDFPLQDILSGSDYDSDTVLLINNETVLGIAKELFGNYPVCINQVKSSKKHYHVTNNDMALIDNELSKSQKYIGRTVNTGQLCMSRYWDLMHDGASEEELSNLMRKIDVVTILSGICIDLAKKMFEININKEIQYISSTKELRKEKPLFWQFVSQANQFDVKFYNCPMDFLFKELTNLNNANYRKDTNLKNLLVERTVANSQRKQEAKILDYVENMVIKLNNIFGSNLSEDEMNRKVEDTIKYYEYYVGKLKVNEDTMHSLLIKLTQNNKTKIAVKLLTTLYRTQKNVFLGSFLSKNATLFNEKS